MTHCVLWRRWADGMVEEPFAHTAGALALDLYWDIVRWHRRPAGAADEDMHCWDCKALAGSSLGPF